MLQIKTTQAVLLLSLLSMTASLGSPLAPVRPPSPNSVQIAWIAEAWSGDDTPYRAIRADVDSLATAGKLTKVLIDEYRRDYEQAKNDPHNVFRYAYAFYRGRQLQPPIYPRNVMTDFPFEAAPSPHTYNYDRIRFLANATGFPDPQFVPVAKRLHERDAHDYDVETWLIRCLRPWKSAGAKQEALDYAIDLTRRDPDKPNAYSTLAIVYLSLWTAGHNRHDAESAIAAYRKCIPLLSPDNPRRAYLESEIKYIQDRMPQ